MIPDPEMPKKIALIQDSLLIKGGSERIFQYLIEAFPEADIYTLAYNDRHAWPEFTKYKIKTSWANWFIRDHSRFKLLFPVVSQIMKYWNLSGYDVILSSSATVAKYLSRFDGVHVCYCYFPTRAIWNPDGYFNSDGFKEKVFRAMLPFLKKQDLAAAKRVHQFIAISMSTQAAIQDIYGRKSKIINCPIDFDHFNKGQLEKKGDHYLIVSRLEHWKQLTYAIEAFNNLGLPLRIVGTGNEEAKLKSIANENIHFVGSVDDAVLVQEYGKAKAVIFTPELEYGLVPLEANAAGTPVIALGRGGVTETMVPVTDASDTSQATAVFFDAPTSVSLIDAIKRFNNLSFNSHALVEHARGYSIPRFQKSMREYIDNM